MKFLLVLLGIIVVSYGKNYAKIIPYDTAYGYMENIGIPLAKELREAEENGLGSSRIVGGVPAGLGQYPFLAGLLTSIIGMNQTGICGGSLISTSRVVTAAHCWFDGEHQAWKVTVVLGSIRLFSGGTRLDTSVAALHPDWNPLMVRNDIAVIYLPNAVTISDTIAPIALPSGNELNDDYVGSFAIASGFGKTSNNGTITSNQYLTHVSLKVITNNICVFAFPFIVQSSNICTSSIGGGSTCNGDSGGPLVVTKDNKHILIGVTSFGSAFGCQTILPAVFTRVTSFVDFIAQHTI